MPLVTFLTMNSLPQNTNNNLSSNDDMTSDVELELVSEVTQTNPSINNDLDYELIHSDNDDEDTEEMALEENSSEFLDYAEVFTASTREFERQMEELMAYVPQSADPYFVLRPDSPEREYAVNPAIVALREALDSYREVFDYVHRVERDVVPMVDAIDRNPDDPEHAHALSSANYFIDAMLEHLPRVWDQVRVDDVDVEESDSDSDSVEPYGTFEDDSDDDDEHSGPRHIGYVYEGTFYALGNTTPDEDTDSSVSDINEYPFYGVNFYQHLLEGSGLPNGPGLAPVIIGDDSLFPLLGEDSESDSESFPDLVSEEEEIHGELVLGFEDDFVAQADEFDEPVRPYETFIPWWEPVWEIIDHVRRNTPEMQNARNHRLELDALSDNGSLDGYSTALEDFDD